MKDIQRGIVGGGQPPAAQPPPPPPIPQIAPAAPPSGAPYPAAGPGNSKRTYRSIIIVLFRCSRLTISQSVHAAVLSNASRLQPLQSLYDYRFVSF